MVNKKLGLLYLCFLAFFSTAFILAGEFPKESARYPKIICILGVFVVMFLLISELIEDIRIRDHKEKLAAKKQEILNATLTKEDLQAIFLFLAMFTAYIAGIFVIGYYISTFLFMVICMSALKKRVSVVYPGVALVFTLLIFFVFSRVLYIVTPKGLLF